jgi:VanZ family protein
LTPRARALLGAWAPPAAWCALVFTGSSFPLRTDAHLFHGADKVAHLLEYGVLGFLLARAAGIARPRWGTGAVVLAAAVLGTLYGASDEGHQSFVPERTAEWGDLAADACGSLLGGALFRALFRRRAPSTAEDPGPAGPAPRPSAPPGP